MNLAEMRGAYIDDGYGYESWILDGMEWQANFDFGASPAPRASDLDPALVHLDQALDQAPLPRHADAATARWCPSDRPRRHRRRRSDRSRDSAA